MLRDYSLTSQRTGCDVHDCNASPWEAEVKGVELEVQDHPWTTCEFETSLGYTETLYFGGMKLANLKMKLANLIKDTSSKCGDSRIGFPRHTGALFKTKPKTQTQNLLIDWR